MEISKTHVFFSLIKFDLVISYDGLFLLMLACIKHFVSLSGYTIWIANFCYFTTSKIANLLGVVNLFIKFSDFIFFLFLCAHISSHENHGWIFLLYSKKKMCSSLLLACFESYFSGFFSYVNCESHPGTQGYALMFKWFVSF